MLHLQRNIVLLIVWVSVLFNLERLGFAIHGSTYLLTTIFVMLALLLPRWIEISTRGAVALTGVTFVVIQLWLDAAIPDAAWLYQTVFELTMVLVSVGLAHEIGRASVDFIAAVRDLLLSDTTASTAESDVAREMQYARRERHPLSVVMVTPESRSDATLRHATAREVQRLLARRYDLVALMRLFGRRIRRTDIMLNQSDKGRMLLVVPKLDHARVEDVLHRLQDAAQHELNVNFCASIASFPEEGLTFEELVTSLEQKLERRSRRRTDGAERNGPVSTDAYDETTNVDGQTGEPSSSYSNGPDPM